MTLSIESIKAIQASEATKTVSDALIAAFAARNGVFFAPDNFNLHDLERFMANRRRAIGFMATTSIDDFAKYNQTHQETGASVFIDSNNMSAISVLNLGTSEKPGHADNTAGLALQETAAYRALTNITSKPQKQADAAEFIEDWQEHITCLDDVGNEIRIAHAVEAFRTITIEAMRKMESNVGDFEQSQGTLDSVKASAAQKLPSRIVFLTHPYKDLGERRFELRVGIQTTDKPTIIFRTIKSEDHAQEMAEELVKLLIEKIGQSIPVHIGKYSRKS